MKQKRLNPDAGFDTLKTALEEWEHKPRRAVAAKARRPRAETGFRMRSAGLIGAAFAVSATVLWLGKRLVSRASS